jgi:hypothetical protein
LGSGSAITRNQKSASQLAIFLRLSARSPDEQALAMASEELGNETAQPESQDLWSCVPGRAGSPIAWTADPYQGYSSTVITPHSPTSPYTPNHTGSNPIVPSINLCFLTRIPPLFRTPTRNRNPSFRALNPKQNLTFESSHHPSSQIPISLYTTFPQCRIAITKLLNTKSASNIPKPPSLNDNQKHQTRYSVM